MDSPSTSQKRKRDAYTDVSMSNGETTVDEEDNHGPRTPTKRLKMNGSFEPALKRKGSSKVLRAANEQNGERAEYKRRRLWPGMT